MIPAHRQQKTPLAQHAIGVAPKTIGSTHVRSGSAPILTQNLGFLSVQDARTENLASIPLTPTFRPTSADGLQLLTVYRQDLDAEAALDHTSQSPGMTGNLRLLSQQM